MWAGAKKRHEKDWKISSVTLFLSSNCAFGNNIHINFLKEDDDSLEKNIFSMKSENSQLHTSPVRRVKKSRVKLIETESETEER